MIHLCEGSNDTSSVPALPADCLSFSVSWSVFTYLAHWPLGDLDTILKLQFSISFHRLVSSLRLRIMPWDECQGTSPMISQDWFRQWICAVMQQAITWANVDPDLSRHMASLGHNEYPWISLIAPWICGNNLKGIINGHIFGIEFVNITCEITPRWMP